MFGKKKDKPKLGIPSLTDKEKPEPLPELPKFSDEEDEDTDSEEENEDEIPDEDEESEEQNVKVEEDDNSEDEIPDEIDLEEDEIPEETLTKKTKSSKTKGNKELNHTGTLNKKDGQEIETEETVLPSKFYTPVEITAVDKGLIQTTIISNVDLKMIVGQVYNLEDGNCGIDSSEVPTPPQEFSTNQNQENMNQTDKKLCLGCYKTLELNENCNCQRQKEENLGYKAIYVKN